MNEYKLPINQSAPVEADKLPTKEQLQPIFDAIYQRILELGIGYGGDSFVIGFARRKDAFSDPDCFIHAVEMEPAYRIEPYFKAKTTRYIGL